MGFLKRAKAVIAQAAETVVLGKSEQRAKELAEELAEETKRRNEEGKK
jgi:hypothetical protein